MEKLILIMCGLFFLSGCSGVKQFTIKDFADNAKTICNLSELGEEKDADNGNGAPEVSLASIGAGAGEILDGIQKSVKYTSKTGCSVHITATSCSFSCGGSDTPKIGSNK